MKRNELENRRMGWTAAWLAAIAFVGISVILAPRGLGLSSDSVNYMQAAKSFLFGNGFTYFSNTGEIAALTVFPPLYPFTLAVGSFFGFDALGWGRWVHSLLFALNVGLISLIVFDLTGRRRSGLLAGILALVSVHLVEAHVRALSEPLFLVFAFGALWCLMAYRENRALKILILGAGLTSLAFLTRYAGAAVLFTGVVTVLAGGTGKRWRDALLYTVLAGALPLVWLIRGMAIDGQLAGRHPVFQPLTLTQILNLPDSFSNLLLPASLPWPLRWGCLAFFLGFVSYIFLRPVPKTEDSRSFPEQSAGAERGLAVLGVYMLAHIVAVIITGWGLGEPVMLADWRMQLPVFVSVIILLPLMLNHQHLLQAGKRVRGLGSVLLVIFLALGFLRTARLARDMYREGYGYNSRSWADTELARNVRSLADDVPVYSNDPQAFYFYAGRPAVLIPSAADTTIYLPGRDRMVADFKTRRAVAVLFHESDFGPHSLWRDFSRELPLSVLLKDVDGSIRGYRPRPEVKAPPVPSSVQTVFVPVPPEEKVNPAP